MFWNKVAIAGVGLLGGSLGLALKQRGLARRVAGLVRRPASVAECAALGVVDEATRDPRAAAEGAELVVLCTPLSRMRSVLEPMLPALAPGAVVTDVGSVKGPVVAALEPLVARAGGYFVGSHPMAGTEKTGPAAARADLFEKAVCVVTPTGGSAGEALAQVERLWRAVGGEVLRLDAAAHDELVSRSSHLPHVLAALLARYVLDPARSGLQAALCATGFRDTTRLASSSPELWGDIALANAAHLGRALGEFTAALQAFRQALEAGDAAAVTAFFETARDRREAWRARGAGPLPE